MKWHKPWIKYKFWDFTLQILNVCFKDIAKGRNIYIYIGFSSKKKKNTIKWARWEKSQKREKTALTSRNLPTIEFAQTLILHQGGPSYEAGTE